MIETLIALPFGKAAVGYILGELCNFVGRKWYYNHKRQQEARDKLVAWAMENGDEEIKSEISKL